MVLIFVWLLNYLILGFCYSNLTRKTGGLELALSITLSYKQTDKPSVLVTPKTKRVYLWLYTAGVFLNLKILLTMPTIIFCFLLEKLEHSLQYCCQRFFKKLFFCVFISTNLENNLCKFACIYSVFLKLPVKHHRFIHLQVGIGRVLSTSDGCQWLFIMN